MKLHEFARKRISHSQLIYFPLTDKRALFLCTIERERERDACMYYVFIIPNDSSCNLVENPAMNSKCKVCNSSLKKQQQLFYYKPNQRLYMKYFNYVA